VSCSSASRDRVSIFASASGPGKASLSLQKHHHRAEHWIVVRGTAEITNGEDDIVRFVDDYGRIEP